MTISVLIPPSSRRRRLTPLRQSCGEGPREGPTHLLWSSASRLPSILSHFHPRDSNSKRAPGRRNAGAREHTIPQVQHLHAWEEGLKKKKNLNATSTCVPMMGVGGGETRRLKQRGDSEHPFCTTPRLRDERSVPQ